MSALRRRSFCLSNVRYWHKIGLRGLNVSFGGKAGIIGPEGQCLLLTQSGHAHELDPGQCYAASVG